MKSKFYAVLLVAGCLTVIYLSGPQVNTDYSIQPKVIPDNVEQYLADSEMRFTDIKPGTEKRIIWADTTNPSPTPYSLVYIHGFSASRQEVAPLCDLLAKRLGANLFYSRLTGHGRNSEAMNTVTTDALLNDAVEALAVGKKIGQRVIVVGTSTGGTLATWLAAQKPTESLSAVILVSPNYGLKRAESELLFYPWGKTLLRMIEGNEYEFTPANALQARFWTTRYPVEAILGMMGIIKVLRHTDLHNVTSPTLVIYSELDKVIDTEKVKSSVSLFASPNKKLVAFNTASDLEQHILAGDVLSPGSTEEILKLITDFLSQVLINVK